MKYNILIAAIAACIQLHPLKTISQEIPGLKVLKNQELKYYLKKDKLDVLEQNGTLTTSQLAAYFRDQFSARFFYDYNSFDHRLSTYNKLYNNGKGHKSRALDHLNKYPDSTKWILPFDYQKGGAVNAYALRHLARQHKMVDIALHYFIENKDPVYIAYFVKQMESLNNALISGAYEKIEGGNGVYEVFRSGFRIFNWLWIHNMFLNEESYSDADQLQTIATLLQHGQHLYERNDQFRSGNHQTKGMSALAVLSILLRDFEGTEQWYERAMARLSEHLEKEINPDGFQFERSVHYHMSDINNYFYVYQLAKINDITVDKTWKNKLESLFITLVKIAYPDKSAPVLQDDTEIPWAEKNDISGAMTLGYLLFDNPEFGYFASDHVDDRMYWYLSDAQVEKLTNIETKKPSFGSLAFKDTHYYIMREGWSKHDKMMIISAGLDKEKPDHQHGDMLGIQAIANEHAILPNYQVRYSLEDFDLFKNSMVKNVALVDNELQGKEWASNKGGSGFGKFSKLPNPQVLAWKSNDAFDLFVGSHDGFENKEVAYSRQVIFVKDDFWIVKDNFNAKDEHAYKQVWQGHYSAELGPDLIRSSSADASGCDIIQLNPIDSVIISGSRGKNWAILSKVNKEDFNFLTVIFPYRGYDNRIDETASYIKIGDWSVNDDKLLLRGTKPTIIHKGIESYTFGVKQVKYQDVTIQASMETDLYLKFGKEDIEVVLLGDSQSSVTILQEKNKQNNISTKVLMPGEKLSLSKN
jgi:hypothetical protein